MLGLLVWVACGATEPEEVSVLLRSAPAAPQAPPTPAASSCDAAAFPVALDIGHTPEAPGATSARGRTEYAFNRDLATTLLTTLRSAGFTGSFLVDPDEGPLSLKERPARAVAGGAVVLLSLHHDSVQPHYLKTWQHSGGTGHYADDFSGFSLWVSLGAATGPQNRALGEALGTALTLAGHTPTLHHAEDVPGERRELLVAELGLYRRDTLAVLRVSTIPTVLVEGGVIVHREEERRLEDPVWREGFSEALVEGLRAFCSTAAVPELAP